MPSLLLVGLLLVGAVGARAAPPPPSLDPAGQAMLDQGEVVMLPAPAASGASARAVVRVGAPPDEIWTIVSDPAHLQAAASGVRSLTVTRDVTLPDGRREQHLSYVVRVGLSDVRYSVIRIYDFADGRMTWTLDTTVDNDISATDGGFTLWPQPDGSTLFGYDIVVDSGRNLPRWILDHLTESGIKRFMRYVRDVAER